MDIALAVAKRSHDAETKVGAILVKNDTGAIIATGYNGFVRNAPDHRLPNTRPTKYQFIVHAEMNLIYHCAGHGIAMSNCTLISTMTPCASCMRGLWQTGITEVVALSKYSDFGYILEMPDIGVEETITPEGFVRLRYVEQK